MYGLTCLLALILLGAPPAWAGPGALPAPHAAASGAGSEGIAAPTPGTGGATALFETAANGVELVGIALLLIGLAWALARFVYRVLRHPEAKTAYGDLRQQLGRTLLLSLEFLVASDIIYTSAVDRTFESLGMLGVLVLIRTFLSFSLEVEISGRLPWRGDGAGEGEGG